MKPDRNSHLLGGYFESEHSLSDFFLRPQRRIQSFQRARMLAS
jgi:hypothetical protein